MKVNHLNFCRQLVTQCSDVLTRPNLNENGRDVLTNVIDLSKASTKFLLPAGGRLFDDKEYRALDENEPLRLPYKNIALEYETNGFCRDESEPVGHIEGVPQFENHDFVDAPKRVLFAREQYNCIVITIAFWTKCDKLWRVLPECGLPQTGYLDRTYKSPIGRVGIKAAFETNIPHSDYMDEIGALLCFLNVLQCGNVKIEQSEAKQSSKKINAAHPFDSYHILTIDPVKHGSKGSGTGEHRSPREHLRRGHIRRLENRKIWVNASVVGAGSGGVITKDYKVAD